MIQSFHSGIEKSCYRRARRAFPVDGRHGVSEDQVWEDTNDGGLRRVVLGLSLSKWGALTNLPRIDLRSAECVVVGTHLDGLSRDYLGDTKLLSTMMWRRFQCNLMRLLELAVVRASPED